MIFICWWSLKPLDWLQTRITVSYDFTRTPVGTAKLDGVEGFLPAEMWISTSYESQHNWSVLPKRVGGYAYQAWRLSRNLMKRFSFTNGKIRRGGDFPEKLMLQKNFYFLIFLSFFKQAVSWERNLVYCICQNDFHFVKKIPSLLRFWNHLNRYYLIAWIRLKHSKKKHILP